MTTNDPVSQARNPRRQTTTPTSDKAIAWKQPSPQSPQKPVGKFSTLYPRPAQANYQGPQTLFG